MEQRGINVNTTLEKNDKSDSQIFITTMHTSGDPGDPGMKESTVDNFPLWTIPKKLMRVNGAAGNQVPPITSGTEEFCSLLQ